MGTSAPYPWYNPANNPSSPYTPAHPTTQQFNNLPPPTHLQSGIPLQPPPYYPAFPYNNYPQPPIYEGFMPPPHYSESAVPYSHDPLQPFTSNNIQCNQIFQPSAPSPVPEIQGTSRLSNNVYASSGGRKDSFNSVPLPLYPATPTDSRDSKANTPRAPSIGFGETLPTNNQPSFYPRLPSDANQTTQGFPPSYLNEPQIPQKTPLPPNLVLLWESNEDVNIFFIQKEGHVVEPECNFKFRAYKLPTSNTPLSLPVGSLSGSVQGCTLLLTLESCWRLGICKQRSYIVKGLSGEIAIYDTSTQPARYVVLVFPKSLKRDERQRLDVLLQATSSMVDEPSNAVDKFESGVGSVFETFTEGMDSLVKKNTPGLHKNTKWLRKSTGQVENNSSKTQGRNPNTDHQAVGQKHPHHICTKHLLFVLEVALYRKEFISSQIVSLTKMNRRKLLRLTENYLMH